MEIGTILLFVIIYIVLYSTFVSLLIYYERRKTVMVDTYVKERPLVSIIVPCYRGDSEEGVDMAINSCLNLIYPNKEIILSWNGPRSALFEKLNKYLEKGVIILETEEKGKAAGMNNAIKMIKGDFFCCLDGDSSFEHDAVNHMIGYFQDEKVAAVTSAMKVHNPKNWIERLQWMEYIFSIYLRRLLALIDCLTVVPGPGSMYRTKMIKEIGGFKSGILTEDMEIAFRIHTYGYKIHSSINCMVNTIAPERFKALLNQRVRWYGGFCENVWAYKKMFLNPKYKTLGLYILPSAAIWILILFYGLYRIFSSTFNAVKYGIKSLYLTGFHPLLILKDWKHLFAFEPNYLTVFSIIMMIIAVVTIFLSLRMAKERVALKKNFWSYALYMFIYSIFLGIFWIATLFYMITRSKLKNWIRW